MFDLMNDHNQYLYHYTSREVLLEKILPSGYFKMNSLKLTNDPRESKEWYIGLDYGDKPLSEAILKLNELQAKINYSTKYGCKIACFTKDKEHDQYRPGDGFFRGFGHARMWAQYADNHKGACLIFDKTSLKETINKELSGLGKIWSGTVAYEDKASFEHDELKMSYNEILEKGMRNAIVDHLHRYYKDLFFHKVSDWADECEYRFVLYSGTEEPQYFKISNSICGICMGVDFPEVYIPALAPFCDKYKLELAKLRWHNGEPMATQWPLPDNQKNKQQKNS
jgi:Protein of unknown function (DUF2971)